uniref:Uncharacterized protein n=1 Tax=Emiliania huxleyi TaxID=2903 RepID=A0A6V2QAH9_EMIHU
MPAEVSVPPVEAACHYVPGAAFRPQYTTYDKAPRREVVGQPHTTTTTTEAAAPAPALARPSRRPAATSRAGATRGGARPRQRRRHNLLRLAARAAGARVWRGGAGGGG